MTSVTKIQTASHSYMYFSWTPRTTQTATCMSHGRSVHQFKSLDRIFTR